MIIRELIRIVGEIVFTFPPTHLPPPVITYLITARLLQPCCHPNEMVSPMIGADLGVLHGVTQCGCCRASNWRGTHIRTFRIFAWALVGLIWIDFVSIGLSYLILSVRMYSSRTCIRDTSQQRTTIFLCLAILSCYSLSSLPFQVLSSPLYSTAFVTLNNTCFIHHE